MGEICAANIDLVNSGFVAFGASLKQFSFNSTTFSHASTYFGFVNSSSSDAVNA